MVYNRIGCMEWASGIIPFLRRDLVSVRRMINVNEVIDHDAKATFQISFPVQVSSLLKLPIGCSES